MARPVTEFRGWRTAATILAIPAAVIVVAGFIVIVTFFAALQDDDVDDAAVNRVENIARSLADDLRDARDLTDAETAAAEVFSSRSPVVEALAWAGGSDAAEGITIDARITVRVTPATSISAERCYRYTVIAQGDVSYHEIPCTAILDPSVPPVSARAELPADADARIEEVLANADGADLADELRQEFPGVTLTIDAATTPDGELVVAVGFVSGTSCVLRVRRTDGEIVSPSYDQIWLEPGEQGCSTGLYTAPPR